MTYYTLAVFQNGEYSPQFGDYDLNVVRQEMRDEWRGFKTKILRTSSARQKEIDKVIRDLNRGWL